MKVYEVLCTNVTCVAANALFFSFNCLQEHGGKILLGNYCYLAFYSASHLWVNDVSIHEFSLCTLVLSFASFVVPRRERKQDLYFEFRRSFNSCFLVLLLEECFCAYLYFSITFFGQYHLFASSAQRVNKTQSYNSKVGWDRQGRCSCLIGSRRVTDSCRRPPIEPNQLVNEVTWRSKWSRIGPLYMTSGPAKFVPITATAANKVEASKIERDCAEC